MHFLKEGQKIRAWVDPPPYSGNARKKTFFLMDLFPKNNREFGFEAQKFYCMNDAAVSQPAISCELEGDRNPGVGEIDKI